ncbi:MAG: hypothetical protein ABIE07_00020 [Candidatus Zixiibacteriota bacterium]
MRKLLTAILCAVVVITIGCEKPLHQIIKADKSLSQYIAGDSTAINQSILQNAIDACNNNDTLWLETGVYFSNPQEFIEGLCGNCSEHQTEVYASTGFVIKDKSLTIIGRGKDSTILITGAGYGVYFENADQSSLLNL